MEPVHVKEALSLPDRVHLFAIQNEGDGSLQYVIEGITICSKKQASFFLIVKCFL